ncbi:MAG TPA: RNA-guided pseudouridylation complex pseudouridine synthase subunit Cbf5, partial [Methanothrix sp.]|nr:RNA-guided pseudouridylation complex pseudouridine synthase subunit Cbf5 [Methanothrix sp.]
TDPKYGVSPEGRPLDIHIRLGCINLDKPPGPTSHEVVAWVKRILEIESAGHSGTLDPKVTGILPTMLGDSTRVVETLLAAGKEYVCLMRLHATLPRKRVMEVCGEFEGVIYQRPPLKSSVKRALRTREIYYLEVLEIEGPRVLFRVGCEAGTYIRKLCHDIGLALGSGAHMEELRRTRSGPFREDETLVTLHDLKDAKEVWRETGDENPLRRAVLPVERALSHMPALVISDGAVDAVCHGAPLAAPGLLRLESGIEEGDKVVIYTLKGEAVAVAVAAMGSEDMMKSAAGIVAKTFRVVMAPGTYPKMWAKRP